MSLAVIRTEEQKAKRREAGRRYREKHREDLAERGRRYYQQNPAKSRGARIKHNYGITLEQYDCMLVSQDGVCAICRKPCKTGRKLAVDHDHKTGNIRGLLCQSCNVMLGSGKDSPLLLKTGADYLEKQPWPTSTIL